MIIGLCGYARSGKDELAKVLVEEHGFHRYAFADVLKDVALDVNPWVSAGRGHVRLADLVNGVGWEAAKTHSLDTRFLLQGLGTAMRNRVHQDIWLDVIRDRVREDLFDNVVITDVRFPNEADWITDHGYLVRVTRPGVGPANAHISETHIDHYPAFEFANTGDLDDLAFLGARLPHMLLGLIGVTAP